MSITVIEEKCTGCRLCIKACPYDAIHIKDKLAVIDLESCTLCSACVDTCKFEAIVIEKVEQETTQDLSVYKGVWVFAEQKKGIIQPVVFELLGKGRELADALGEQVTAILLGNNVETQAEMLIKKGADKVYVVESPHLRNYQDEP